MGCFETFGNNLAAYYLGVESHSRHVANQEHVVCRYLYIYISIDVYINISSFDKTHKQNDESSNTC